MRDDIAGTDSGKASEMSDPALGMGEAEFRALEAADFLEFVSRVGSKFAIGVSVMALVAFSYWRDHPYRAASLRGVQIGWRVDLTTADAATLQLLPGIGPTLAGRIVELRDAGVITEPDDLLRVTGIGRKTFDRLRPYVADASMPDASHMPSSAPRDDE